MNMKKQENISLLLKNFVNSQKDILITFLYSRDGQLMCKYGKFEIENIDENEIKQIYEEHKALAENLIKKISLEYKKGSFGTGTFEAPDNRIIFLEAGPDAILFCICKYEINLEKIFPIAYLVVEKLAQLLEGSFDFRYNSLGIPDLTFSDNFSLELDRICEDRTEPFYDGIYLDHQIKMARNKKLSFKLILLGDAAVGKTTLVNSFLKKHQISDYRPTIGIAMSTQKYYIQGFKDEIISFLIFDIAGQEFFRRLRHSYYTRANCAFIVYDVTRRDTLNEAIDFWFKDAQSELGDISFTLIGNKIDLEDEREVSKEEGLKAANEIKASFIETSALQNINVQDTFKLVGFGLFIKHIRDMLDSH